MSEAVGAGRLGPIQLDWWGWRLLGWLAVAITAAVTVLILVNAYVIGPNPWRDGDAYLNAALRLREGQPLYPALDDYQEATVYRYAPWFAYAWVPLSFLPRDLVIIVWQLAMFACSALAIWPAWRSGLVGRAIVVVVVPFLVFASLIGNVQPAMVALLVYTVRQRSGPVAVAITASLKVVPVLYVVTYLGRRQWRAAAVAVGLTLLLWAPALLLDLTYYPSEIGETTGLWAFSPILWTGITIALVAIAYVIARRPEAWYSSSLLVTLATPRFISYDWTFMLVGPAGQPSTSAQEGSAAGYPRPDAEPSVR